MANTTVKQATKKRNLRKRNAITGLLFILPFIIGFLVFLVWPMCQSFAMSLCNVTLNKKGVGYSLKLIKAWDKSNNYYNAFLVNPDFTTRLTDSLKSMAVRVPAVLIFSFFVALMLNQKFAGRGFVRAIFFLPVILSSGVIVGLDTNNSLLGSMKDVIADQGSGVSITEGIKSILRTTGIGGKILKPVFEIIDGVYDVALASGIQIIIFISALQTVSPSMYEAAKIEGCTAWESFWKITFPMVSSMILVNLVYTVIDFMMRTDNGVMQLITDKNTQMEYGLSTAMAWSYFAIIAAILGIVSFILSKVVYYYE